MSRISVAKIPNLNTLVIKQYDGRNFFISASDSIIISIPNLAFLIKFLVQNDYMSKRVIEGILSELEDWLKHLMVSVYEGVDVVIYKCMKCGRIIKLESGYYDVLYEGDRKVDHTDDTNKKRSLVFWKSGSR